MRLNRDWKAPQGCKEPMRTFVELAAEFGVTPAQLRVAMANSRSAVPAGFKPSTTHQRATHYPHRQMQRWWAAEQAARAAEGSPA